MKNTLEDLGQLLANAIPDNAGGIIILLNEDNKNDSKAYYLSNLPKDRTIEELRLLADAIETNNMKKNPYDNEGEIIEDSKIYKSNNETDILS